MKYRFLVNLARNLTVRIMNLTRLHLKVPNPNSLKRFLLKDLALEGEFGAQPALISILSF